MTFRVRTESHATRGGYDGTVFVLEDGRANRAAVWPAFGFNCYSWQVTRGGRVLDLLYADPELFNDSKPTRSGIPILFPFPNRIRDGRFTWDGQDYQLPLNDPSGKNAIHGFVASRPWRVLDHGTDDFLTWVTAEFSLAVFTPPFCCYRMCIGGALPSSMHRPESSRS